MIWMVDIQSILYNPFTQLRPTVLKDTATSGTSEASYVSGTNHECRTGGLSLTNSKHDTSNTSGMGGTSFTCGKIAISGKSDKCHTNGNAM